MIGSFKRYDMNRHPNRPWFVLTPITWLLGFLKVWSHRNRMDKSGLPAGLKPPYFLLCNHNAFMDFTVTVKGIFPHPGNYIVAIDGFIGIEWLLRRVGGICTRKFVTDTTLVKHMLRARNNGNIVILYPEARYSLCGTTAILPESLGKMVRLMNIPVVTLIAHGHHINSPFWNVGNRKVKPTEAEMKLLFTQEETKSLPVDELNRRIAEAFAYDDFAWQKERGIRVSSQKRAEGLHKVLYQCPACKKEYVMTSEGATLRCAHCGKVWDMTELGELQAQNGETEFSHIPDWYEWQRGNVRREVEAGAYSFEAEVRVESLPNAKRFITFPEPGHLTHNSDGFTLTGVYEGEPFELRWSPQALYSCHIEYDYMGRGDCIDLNTNDDTLYLFPAGDNFAITKISLATEELHKLHRIKAH